MLEQEGQAHAQQESQGDGNGEIDLKIGFEGPGRHGRRVDDGDVVFADAGDHAHLLHALQEPVVQFPAGIHLTLQSLIVGAAILQGQDLLLELGDMADQFGLLAGLRVIFRLQGGGDQPGLALDLLIQSIDLLHQLLHLGVAGLQQLAFLIVFLFEFVALLLEVLDDLIGNCIGRCIGTAPGQFLIFRFDRVPLRLGLGQLLAHRVQFVEGGLQPIVDVDDLAVSRIGGKALLGVFERGTGLFELFPQEAFGVSRRLVASLEIQIDEVGRERVEDVDRLRWVATVIVDLDQARVTYGLDTQAFQKSNLILLPGDALRVDAHHAGWYGVVARL